MNSMIGRWKRLVCKKIVPGDIRKLNAESNDAQSGGGARDFRFSPAEMFFPVFNAMFPDIDSEKCLKAKFLWENGEITNTLIHPPTPSRANEMRIARIHECCPASLVPSDGEDSLLVIIQDDAGVHASFETPDTFKHKGFSDKLQKYCERLLSNSHPANITPACFIDFEKDTHFSNTGEHMNTKMFQPYAGIDSILSAIRAKPFILLAGMSGTGKTRIVRQLARGCCPTDSDLGKDPDRPGNYECIPVRPNWHDSTGLMGYITRITDDGKPKYVTTEFVRFLAKAWLCEDKGIPFFLCLDEMNLAPVEQYFAEYLSVIESRRVKDGKIVTDPLVRVADEKLLKGLLNEVYPNQAGEVANLVKMFVELGGIPIPSNFVVMGTVNMDETTCSFPRKVLDRAMTFELNEFDVDSGLESNPDIALGSIDKGLAKCSFTHGWQVYAANKDVCDKLKPYLVALDKALKGEHGTPFRFAYRTRDEFMAYCVERIKDGTPLSAAADEATSMKILSRIEGDEQVVKKGWLQNLKTVAVDELKKLMVDGDPNPTATESKLDEMLGRLDYGSTSFWF